MKNNQLRLYVDANFLSPYAMSAFVALTEKQLPFEMITLDLAAHEHQAAHLADKLSTRRIPTLLHGEFALSESSAIDEYIDETFPGTALYPSDAKSKAKARQIQAWLRSDLLAIRQERSTEVVFYGTRKEALSSAALAAAEKLFAAVENWLLGGAEHVCGAWSIADVDLAVMLNRLVLHGDAVPPRLAAYAAKQWQRPSVQQWLQQKRPPL